MTTSVPAKTASSASWINVCVIAGSAMFILALTVAAIFAPQWRVLHVAQALIYVAVIVLARRRSAWGFGAGVVVPAFWTALLLFRSPVGTALVHGQVSQPDVFLQLFGAVGNCLIIVACLAAFLGAQPGGRKWAQFAAGGALSLGYLLAAVFTIGPPEGAQHIRQALGL
jgi:hypothetical protein